MKYVIVGVMILGVVSITLAGDGGQGKDPALETFVIAPIEIATVQVWVPVDKVGPVINRACRDRCGNQYKCLIPASVNHEKTKACISGVGRILAEYVWPLYEASLPLTIFNGWKWEFPYNLSQFEAFEFDLPKRGGSWENSLEAILSETQGSIRGMWVGSDGRAVGAASGDDRWESTLGVRTFSSTRIRYGYPKVRKLR